MNILIVDDNKNNRMIMSLLLEDYMEENTGVEFSLDEAVDGLEAVRMCESKKYDIVLMDIMMPNMDGIEATKLIRHNDTQVMIIAVSAVDDQARQKEILTHGAEDYISKPVNADIFNTRISNYINLINSRSSKSIKNEEGVNLFTKEIFNRYTNFKLSNEDALSELWECFLLEGDGNYEGLSDVVRMIFSLGEVQLRLGVKSNLIVESSYDYQYFTVNNIDAIPTQVLKLLLKKNEVTAEYKIEDNKLSFKLAKIEEVFEAEEAIAVPVVEPIKIIEKKPEEISSSIDYTSAQLQVFDYIDPDDMADLEEFAGKLNSLMLVVGSGDVSDEEAVEIYTYIEKLGSILSSYSEIYVIANSLSALANDMAANTDTFMQNSEALGPMCSAFSNDLTNWIEQSFHTGAPSVDFMNDTIVVNCQTIGSMLKMDEVAVGTEEDFDDIFDF
ncbi:response regulator [Sulfurimonas sp. SAG-AH-194-C20]|nr:response regulator [Sulfurimonas sp. SAG-AH-194-C20]MDF1879174.1 response regulator [Sulfurimonas sp. SAG-AH-194-C20]